MGGPASPRLSKATFLPPPSLCPPPLTQAAGPPLLWVMSAPPRPPQEHCGQIWRTQQCLGAGTDWGGGAAAPGRDCWQLARGRGAPGEGGGGRKDKSRREARPPSLPLAHRLQARPTFQAHSWGPEAPTQGPAGDPHPTQPCPGALCAGYAAAWVPRLMPSENICTPPPSPRHSRALAGRWAVAPGWGLN